MQVLETVTEMADKLSPSEQLQLIEHIAKRLQMKISDKKKPQSLRGSWKGKFPEDIEVEADIQEIRDEWKKEFDEF